MKYIDILQPRFERAQRTSLMIGILGALLLGAGAYISGGQFFQSYLYGYMFWMLCTVGSLGILLLHHLVSGSWGYVIQRMLESGSRTVPLMALLFLPLLFGLNDLYPWTKPEIVESSHAVHQKAGYLNVPFFLTRTALYFILWSAIAFRLSALSKQQDSTGDPHITRHMKTLSGPGLVVFVLTATFAAVDWMMSIEPEWFSTIYGAQILVGGVLSALALYIVVLGKLSHVEPFADVLTTRHSHHLGNLLMAFTILWAYMSFSQYLIIWSGNLPEDNFWYIHRIGSGWSAMALILLIGHFFVPFLLLLSRERKRHIGNLMQVAFIILAMRLVDLFWLIVPAFSTEGFRFHWLDIAAPLGIGGLWIATFFWLLKGNTLLPLHDPRFTGDPGH